MPIEFRIGDLFADRELRALAHGCNCAGSMGRGIAVDAADTGILRAVYQLPDQAV